MIPAKVKLKLKNRWEIIGTSNTMALHSQEYGRGAPLVRCASVGPDVCNLLFRLGLFGSKTKIVEKRCF